MILHYVIGQPGAGKSTAVRSALAHLPRTSRPKPLAHTVYATEDGRDIAAIQLGVDRQDFPGTDTLSMGVFPVAVDFLKSYPAPVVIGEGDRLASKKFFEEAVLAGYRVNVILIDTPDQLAGDRRAARGSTQNETWLKGRITKTANLTEHYRPVSIDGAQAPEAVAAQLRECFGL